VDLFVVAIIDFPRYYLVLFIIFIFYFLEVYISLVDVVFILLEVAAGLLDFAILDFQEILISVVYSFDILLPGGINESFWTGDFPLFIVCVTARTSHILQLGGHADISHVMNSIYHDCQSEYCRTFTLT
jgi:hypothetical protein